MVSQTYIFQGLVWGFIGLSLTACSSHVHTDRYGADSYQQKVSSHYSYSSQTELKASRYGGPVTSPCDVAKQPCSYVVQYVAVPPPPLRPQPLRPQIECCDPPSISEPPASLLPPISEPPISESPVYEPPINEPPISYPPIDNPEPPVWMPPKK
jgi:hypothetical protein